MKKMKWGALLVCLLAVTMSIQVFSAQSVMPLAGKTILVDSGHGGKDDGAQRGEVKEDAINLAIAMEVRKQLIEQGANVLMTREDDHDLAEEDSENRKRDDMKKRVEFIECGFCDMFVSIHLNAYPDSSVRGAQVFYQPDSMQSERMAQLMQEELSSCSGQQRKQKPGDYYILNSDAHHRAGHTGRVRFFVQCGRAIDAAERGLSEKDRDGHRAGTGPLCQRNVTWLTKKGEFPVDTCRMKWYHE